MVIAATSSSLLCHTSPRVRELLFILILFLCKEVQWLATVADKGEKISRVHLSCEDNVKLSNLCKPSTFLPIAITSLIHGSYMTQCVEEKQTIRFE